MGRGGERLPLRPPFAPLLAAALALPAMGAAVPSKAAAPTDPVATVREMERDFRRALPPGPGRTEVERISSQRIAWDEVARECVGDGLGRLPPADRKSVTSAVRALVEETWLPILLRADRLYAFAVFGSEVKGVDARVRTRAQAGGSQVELDLRLFRGKDGRFRVTGVTVDGADVLATWRAELPGLLAAQGPGGLVATLDARRKTLQDLRKAGRAP